MYNRSQESSKPLVQSRPPEEAPQENLTPGFLDRQRRLILGSYPPPPSLSTSANTPAPLSKSTLPLSPFNTDPKLSPLSRSWTAPAGSSASPEVVQKTLSQSNSAPNQPQPKGWAAKFAESLGWGSSAAPTTNPRESKLYSASPPDIRFNPRGSKLFSVLPPLPPISPPTSPFLEKDAKKVPILVRWGHPFGESYKPTQEGEWFEEHVEREIKDKIGHMNEEIDGFNSGVKRAKDKRPRVQKIDAKGRKEAMEHVMEMVMSGKLVHMGNGRYRRAHQDSEGEGA